MDDVELDVTQLVRAIIEDARRSAGGGPAFAERLRAAGVQPKPGVGYSSSSVSNWILGRAMPPADVLIAAARIAGVSLDERILGQVALAGATDTSGAIEGLQRQIETLQAQMIEVYRLLGAPMPGATVARDLGQARGG